MGGDGDGNENENEDENGHEDRDGGESGSGNKNDNREEGGGEGEPGNLQSYSRGWAKDSRGGAMPTTNQQPEPQDPTPQQDHRIMWRT